MRRGLAESLESFTARAGGGSGLATTDAYRWCWRLQGLRALNATVLGVSAASLTWEALVPFVHTHAVCCVAPGVSIPTRPTGLE